VCFFMFEHNSGTPGAISTKLGTHIAICMRKNIRYVLYIYLSPKYQFPKGIWMIHVVEEIKLLLLLGNVWLRRHHWLQLVRRIHVSI
jgi:hypothetical protein